MLLALLIAMQAASVRETPPILEFPTAGLDDPAAYEGYTARLYRDSRGNSVEIYLEVGDVDPHGLVGTAAQGLGPGEFSELVQAIRAGVTYVNVHNATFPAGEIRGQVNDANQR